MAGTRQPAPAQPVSTRCPDAQPKVCKFYKQGRCGKGANCTFLHGDEPGRVVSPNTNERPSAPTLVDTATKVPCKFYKQGQCGKGAYCTFLHQDERGDIVLSGTNGKPSSPALVDSTPKVPCKYFARGSCINGANCRYAHQGMTENASVSSPPTFPVTSDTRKQVLCKFFVNGGCNNGEFCPWSHAQDGQDGHIQRTPEEDTDKIEDTMSRDMCGALVRFGDGAEIVKISLSSDFSATHIDNLPAGSTPLSITQLLSRAGLTIPVSSVRILPQNDDTSGRTATIRVEDPSFAGRLRHLLEKGDIPGAEGATAKTINITLPQSQSASSRRIDCKKVHCSWHKPTKTAWLNFGSENIAQKVRDRYESGVYKVLDQKVKSTGPTRGAGRFNPHAWTLMLADLDATTTESEILQAIPIGMRPRHVEIGKPSYDEEPDLAMVKVLSMLTHVGPLETWDTGARDGGKRMKATARFQDENDAMRAAALLNGVTLPFSKSARLTAQLVFTARLKVSDRIYGAVRKDIEAERQAWRSQHVLFIPYPAARGYRVLKLEGEDNKSVANSKGTLEGILAGEIALHDGKPVWTQSFGVSTRPQGRLKEIETSFGVVIVRNKRRSRLHLYGPPEKRREAVRKLAGLAAEEASSAHAIDLTAEQFAWACRGGFKTISDILGEGVAAINVTSTGRRLLINGSDDDLIRAKRMVENPGKTEKLPDGRLAGTENCAICWTEAEDPVRTPCGHTYCADCFESFCFNKPTGAGFRIRCEGAMGECKAVLAFSELRELLSSNTFEDLLEASFASYIEQHPDVFRNCRTPDCDQIYRVTTMPGTFTCTRCFETTCTKCNERHNLRVSCEEHFRAGDQRVLEDAKRKMGIKDCPRCKTSIEKTEGCNHMTCRGCQAHLCWVCLETFESSGLCYDHLRKMHGGIFPDGYGD